MFDQVDAYSWAPAPSGGVNADNLGPVKQLLEQAGLWGQVAPNGFDAGGGARDMAGQRSGVNWGALQGYTVGRKQIGDNQFEAALKDPAGNVVATQQYEGSKDSWLDNVMEVVVPAALAWMGGTAIAGGGAAGAGGGGLSGMDLAADAAVGSGNSIGTAAAQFGGGGIAGTGIPAFAQQPGYGNTVANLASSSNASPFTGAAPASVADPVSAYLTTGGAEGSIMGNGLTGAGGAAGAVGAGTAANYLGTASNLLGGIGNFAGGNAGLVNLGGNLLNSAIGYNASRNAVNAQQESGRASNELQKYMFDQIRQDNLPALDARNFGLTGYRNLLADPGSVIKTPGYDFRFKQGVNAYDNSGAARGMRLSGAQAKGLTEFGQNFATGELDRALNRYGNVSGLGQVGAGTIANAGQTYATNAGNTLTGMGNAAASGYIGGANAISGGVNNFLRNWNEQQLLDKYLRP